MTARCEVLEEEEESYSGKSGRKLIHVWRCDDRTPAGALAQSFDYLPTEEEHRSFTGKIKGRMIDLAITKIWEGFNRRLRASGKVQMEKR